MFPLGTVLFPTAVLPLHVFEPRYRAMVRDCLAAEREMGVVLIERGSEVGGDDVRSDLGTVAHIVQAEELPDGRWGLVAVGARRLRVVQWLPDDPYPVAEVEDWPDPEPQPGYGEQAAAVAARLRQVLALAAEAGDRTVPATLELSDDPVLAVLQAAAVGPFGPLDRQRLLAAETPDARADLLEELLADALAVLQMRLSE
jgi:Lon protease-like protein